MNLSSFTLYKFKRSSKRWKIFSTIKSMKKLFLFFAKKNVSEKDENSTKSENFNVQSSITLTRKKKSCSKFQRIVAKGKLWSSNSWRVQSWTKFSNALKGSRAHDVSQEKQYPRFSTHYSGIKTLLKNCFKRAQVHCYIELLVTKYI